MVWTVESTIVFRSFPDCFPIANCFPIVFVLSDCFHIGFQLFPDRFPIVFQDKLFSAYWPKSGRVLNMNLSRAYILAGRTQAVK